MIYVFLANGFEEIEAIAAIDILRRAELEVLTVGVTGEIVRGAHAITVAADILPDEIDREKIDLIVLPGGMPGTLNLESSAAVTQTILYCATHDIPIGAICAAPSILGHMGLLEGRQATCFPGFEEELKGAVISEKGVVTDGKIITAKGAGAAVGFALEMVSLLCGKEISEKIERSLQVY